MVHRRFRLQVLVRAALLAATLGAGAWLAYAGGLVVPAILTVLFAAWQVVLLVRYIEKTNRDLARLLRSIRYSDFSQTFGSDGRGGGFTELAGAFRAVMDDFRAARAEKEEGYRYLETVMQHVGVGLLSFDASGEVSLVNGAAKRLLRVKHLRTVQSLRPTSPELVDALMTLPYGGKALVRVTAGEDTMQLSLHATGFKLRSELIKLVSIQDIGGELAEMEAAAWQKLTRVLTHEIMNSVAPISSLAGTASALLDDVPSGGEALDDVRSAVDTIARRSDGLLHFVQAYRRLTRVPEPRLAAFVVRDLVRSIVELYDSTFAERGVRHVASVVPERLEIVADRELVEQVLINLVRNALDAVAETPDPEVRIEAFIDDRSRAVVQVVDNGPGIPEEALDTIFVPFFTTKKEGSGIGLSLSREIMRQHGGTITAQSAPGVRTVLRLRF
jgi:nitrogen fixation/metabolism regulation signal transduction histidine kinase